MRSRPCFMTSESAADVYAVGAKSFAVVKLFFPKMFSRVLGDGG
jgi:hypothetical protein